MCYNHPLQDKMTPDEAVSFRELQGRTDIQVGRVDKADRGPQYFGEKLFW